MCKLTDTMNLADVMGRLDETFDIADLNALIYHGNLVLSKAALGTGVAAAPIAQLSGKVSITVSTGSVPACSDELHYLPYLIALKYLLPIQITPDNLDMLAIIAAKHVELKEKLQVLSRVSSRTSEQAH
ncbi:hypothetical protein F1609_13165 [Massilia sp. CCM 8693]|uniref:Uncharacterized protein n=2 Tax=Massilia aquatica TaxID=2609000 RepID=A0ABX0M2K1_9BURK|nr:hypothetical protein [Massilia aquatica]